nr:hypothetical protein [Tanacetum cinerariifolium]
MENEHELSYEALTRVYLESYENYKSVGAEVELLEAGFELDDQEWVEIGSFSFERLWDELYMLETSMEDVEGVCGVAAYMEQKGKMWPFLGPRNRLHYKLWISVVGWYFVFAVLGLVAYFVANLTHNTARSLVVIMVTVIIVVVVLEIVVVVIVGVVIVVTGGVSSIFKFSFVIIGFWSLFNSVQAILLACSIPIGWAYAFHQDKASLVRVPVANVTLSYLAHLLRENTDSFPFFATGVSFDLRFLLGFSVFAMVAASAAAIPSEINCRMAA